MESTAVTAFSNHTFKKTWLGCIDTKQHDRILNPFKRAVLKVIQEDFANINNPSLGQEEKRNNNY